jgi:hypothetical protein
LRFIPSRVGDSLLRDPRKGRLRRQYLEVSYDSVLGMLLTQMFQERIRMVIVDGVVAIPGDGPKDPQASGDSDETFFLTTII